MFYEEERKVMDLPGEKLLIRMWETLAEKGVGGLLGPWQERRMGYARADVMRHERLILAEADRQIGADSALIAAGSNDAAAPTILLTHGGAEHALDQDSVVHVLATALRDDVIRKEMNIANAVLAAEERLLSSEADEPSESVGDDWLFRWRDSAAQVGNEEMRRIWGRVLADEVVRPGTFSFRTLEFLRNASKDDAILVAKIKPFVMTGGMILKTASFPGDFSFSALLELQDLGIITGVDGLGLATQAKPSPGEAWVTLACGARLFMAKHPGSEESSIELSVYKVTTLGMQLLSLVDFPLDRTAESEAHLKAACSELKSKGLDVQLAGYVPLANGRYRLVDIMSFEV